MNKSQLFFIMVAACVLCSCATIPPESVELSSQIGVGLQKQHQSQIDLINLHFTIKRKALDQAFEKALNTYFTTITPSGSVSLNRNQLKDVAKDVMDLNSKNTAAKEELEAARILLSKKLNENYLSLNLANASVTGLLQSAVTVKEARSDAFKKLSEVSGGKVDLEKIFTEIDNFMVEGGDKTKKVLKLKDKVEKYFNDENKENNNE